MRRLRRNSGIKKDGTAVSQSQGGGLFSVLLVRQEKMTIREPERGSKHFRAVDQTICSVWAYQERWISSTKR
jgi:hypothetical protein